jgi:hypothetical protein
MSEIKLPAKYNAGMGYMDANDAWLGPSQIVPALNSLPALVEALELAKAFWYDDMPNPSDDAIELHDKVVKLLKELK